MYETVTKKLSDIDFPTSFGEFSLRLYSDDSNKNHLALVKGDIEGKEEVLVRVHSKCLTGDVFGSLRCDCGSQLKQAMEIIEEKNEGILLYLNQEGRGIGLKPKLESYKLQDKGFDTVEANKELGYDADTREYNVAADILKEMNVKSIKLLSNNPDKVKKLKENDISVKERVPLNPKVTNENISYLQTKANRLNHDIDLEKSSQLTPEREKVLRFFSRKINSKEKIVTLFFKQNLCGEIIDDYDEVGEIEKNELGFLTKSLRKKHDLTITSINETKNKKELFNKKPRKNSILIEADIDSIEEVIKKDLFDLFIGIIYPSKEGTELEEMNELYVGDKEINYANLGELIVVYGDKR